MPLLISLGVCALGVVVTSRTVRSGTRQAIGGNSRNPVPPSGRPNPHLAVARVDRQHRLIEALAARAPRFVSAATIAEALEVSTRTVERDLVDLAAAGIPVQARRGPDGGYAISGMRDVADVQLEQGEIAVLIAALVGLGDYASATARSTLSKLWAAARTDLR
jgi:predicted DNA-binding transcriptional regulator YafY